jgi:hypothetical protein
MEKERKPFVHLGYQFTEEDILRAMANTRSNAEASRYLKCSINTYEKYAKSYIDPNTGKSLWHIHMNTASRGIPKKWTTSAWKGNLEDLLKEKQLNNPKRLARLKDLLMKDGRLGYCCTTCNFSEKRLTDMKVPLMLHFKNGVRTDWRIENLQWLCYNCSFLYGLDYFSNRMVRDIETMQSDNQEQKDDVKKFYEIDDFYLDHLNKLGLDDKGDIKQSDTSKNPDQKYFDSGEEFIDFS